MVGFFLGLIHTTGGLFNICRYLFVFLVLESAESFLDYCKQNDRIIEKHPIEIKLSSSIINWAIVFLKFYIYLLHVHIVILDFYTFLEAWLNFFEALFIQLNAR